MGANAQTSVPTFTAGEVLTAANMNISARTGIPVFADSTARDAAFGGTGEKTLAEGQYAYLESTNQTLVYDGSSWLVVGASGLTLISATTIGTTVASVTVTGAFSATYDNYRIIISGGVASTNASMRFQLSGITTGYYSATLYRSFGAVTGGEELVNQSTAYIGQGTSLGLSAVVDVRNPNVALAKSFNHQAVEMATDGSMKVGGGYNASNTQATGFVINLGSGTMTGGTIRVYGYANS